MSDRPYQVELRTILTGNPNATRDEILKELKKKFPTKSDATLGERLSNFAIAEESPTGKHYVMRKIPRDEEKESGASRAPTPAPAGASAPPETTKPIVVSKAVTPAQLAAATGEDSAIAYEGEDPRLRGSKWFRRRLDAESGSQMQSADTEPWEVVFPGGERWQFEIPTNKATDGYEPRQLGDRTDVQMIQGLLMTFRPALFIGHTGVGKTAVVSAACGDPKWVKNQEAGNTPWLRPRIYRAVMSNMNYEQLIGQFVPDIRAGQPRPDGKGVYGNFRWQDGILTRMATFGGIFIADEINFTAPDVLVSLNSLLDKDRMIIIPQDEGRIVHAHKDFRLLAAMNPSGYGYAGAKTLNIALKSRFSSLFWYDWAPEVERKRFRPSAEVPGITGLQMKYVHEMFADLRDAFRAGTFHYPPGFRDIVNFVDNCRQFGIERAIISFLMLYDDPRERSMVLLRIRNHIDRVYIPNLSLDSAAQLFS